MFVPLWVFYLIVYGVFCFFNPKLWQFTKKWTGIAFVSAFLLVNSPLIASYYLAHELMKLDKDHWSTQLFVLVLGFGLYYSIVFILNHLFS